MSATAGEYAIGTVVLPVETWRTLQRLARSRDVAMERALVDATAAWAKAGTPGLHLPQPVATSYAADRFSLAMFTALRWWLAQPGNDRSTAELLDAGHAAVAASDLGALKVPAGELRAIAEDRYHPARLAALKALLGLRDHARRLSVAMGNPLPSGEPK